MKVAVTGSSGLVGKALCSELSKGGHEVVHITRNKSSQGSNQIVWSPEDGSIEEAKLQGVDGVINLAGESIAAKRWTPEQKEKIRQSRVKGTKLLASTIAKTPSVKVLVNASAIGFYGDRGDEELNELSKTGTGFLSEVCREWEDAASQASAGGARVVMTRFGIILSQNGGAMQKMLPVFQLGGGGIIGNGRQFMSWIALEDVAKALVFALTNESVSGPVNVVAPAPVRNSEFTSTLGKVIQRPTIMPLPAFAAKIIMGEMADELLLASDKVAPTVLKKHGFEFDYPTLEGALRKALHKSS